LPFDASIGKKKGTRPHCYIEKQKGVSSKRKEGKRGEEPTLRYRAEKKGRKRSCAKKKSLSYWDWEKKAKKEYCDWQGGGGGKKRKGIEGRTTIRLLSIQGNRERKVGITSLRTPGRKKKKKNYEEKKTIALALMDQKKKPLDRDSSKRGNTRKPPNEFCVTRRSKGKTR